MGTQSMGHERRIVATALALHSGLEFRPKSLRTPRGATMFCPAAQVYVTLRTTSVRANGAADARDYLRDFFVPLRAHLCFR
jgi:hypothetical protein